MRMRQKIRGEKVKNRKVKRNKKKNSKKRSQRKRKMRNRSKLKGVRNRVVKNSHLGMMDGTSLNKNNLKNSPSKLSKILSQSHNHKLLHKSRLKNGDPKLTLIPNYLLTKIHLLCYQVNRRKKSNNTRTTIISKI